MRSEDMTAEIARYADMGQAGEDGALRSVRQSYAHDSAALHVSGAAAYIDDIREPAGTLHIAVGGAPIARGVLNKLDLDAVRAAPGVVQVLTATDIPGKNDVAPAFGDDPMFVETDILFHQQVVFAVVAETRDAARRATRLAKMECTASSPVVSVDEALADGGTVLPDYAFGRGDVEEASADAEHILRGSFRIGGQEHFYLEGQAALAIPGEGDMLVHSSTQDPTEVQHIVARVLAFPDSFVTVETRRMGGGFGGKESQASQWAAIAALAALRTGRPCKIRLDRDDDFALTGKRHDFRADWTAAFDRGGMFRSYDIDLHARCGYSADLSLGVVDRAMFHSANGYWLPAVAVRSKRLKTNTVSNTAFRGFGGPQGMLAIERVMDAVAHRLGRDPLDIRKQNFYSPGCDVTPFGQVVEDTATLPAIVDMLEASSDYRARRADIAAFNADSRVLKKGIALTPVQFGIAFTLVHLNQAGALVHVYQDGSVHLNHGGTEMGQGLFTKVAQVVAEEFGIPLEWVRITATNTAKVPNASPTAASSGTDLNGMAARIAAREIKQRMVAYAAHAYDAAPEAIVFRDGNRPCRKRDVGFRGTCEKMPRRARSFVVGRILPHADDYLGQAKRDGARVSLFFLRRGLFGSHRRHAHRRNACHARRFAARCRPLDQSRDRQRPDRGRLRAGHGLADDGGTRLRPERPPADTCTRDVQNSGRIGCARGLPLRALSEPQSRDDDLRIESGRRASADAGDLGVFRDP